MQIECFFPLVRNNMLWKSQTAQNLNTDQCIKTIFLPVKKGSMSDGNKNDDSRQFRLTQLPYATVLQQSRKRKWADLMA